MQIYFYSLTFRLAYELRLITLTGEPNESFEALLKTQIIAYLFREQCFF